MCLLVQNLPRQFQRTPWDGRSCERKIACGRPEVHRCNPTNKKLYDVCWISTAECESRFFQNEMIDEQTIIHYKLTIIRSYPFVHLVLQILMHLAQFLHYGDILVEHSIGIDSKKFAIWIDGFGVNFSHFLSDHANSMNGVIAQSHRSSVLFLEW